MRRYVCGGILALLTAWAVACGSPSEPVHGPDIDGTWSGCTADGVRCVTMTVGPALAVKFRGAGTVTDARGAHHVIVTGGYAIHGDGTLGVTLAGSSLREPYTIAGDVVVDEIHGELYGNGVAGEAITLVPVVRP